LFKKRRPKKAIRAKPRKSKFLTRTYVAQFVQNEINKSVDKKLTDFSEWMGRQVDLFWDRFKTDMKAEQDRLLWRQMSFETLIENKFRAQQKKMKGKPPEPREAPKKEKTIYSKLLARKKRIEAKQRSNA
jgi:hypothetical protein